VVELDAGIEDVEEGYNINEEEEKDESDFRGLVKVYSLRGFLLHSVSLFRITRYFCLNRILSI
jgi:hypothetical protein